MRLRTERRKFFSNLKCSVAAPALALAAVVLFPADGLSQEAAGGPTLSVFRKNVGVVSSLAGKSSITRTGDSHHEFVTGDFDADGLLDPGSFDPVSGLFSIRRSGDGSTLVVSVQNSKGKPALAAADYDGDKRIDPAVWRNGTWQMMLSSRDYAADLAIFGIAGDVPVPADFDGDGRADLSVFRPAENRWYVRSSESGGVRTFDLGIAVTDLLLPADYTGDGKADPAVYGNGIWRILDSETGEVDTFEFGFEDARPVPGDIDRDGRVEFAVFRKGTWYIYDGAGLVSYKFGEEDDVPLGSVTVRASTPGR